MVIDTSALLAILLAESDADALPMTPEAATFARSAYARYGKGIGSPAVLNYGDCLAYGVARAAGEPLLSKGEDFRATDIEAAA